MVISDALDYAAVFEAVESATVTLGRPVNPTVYSRAELKKRIDKDNAFIRKVWEQPRIWVVGERNESGA